MTESYWMLESVEIHPPKIHTQMDADRKRKGKEGRRRGGTSSIRSKTVWVSFLAPSGPAGGPLSRGVQPPSLGWTPHPQADAPTDFPPQLLVQKLLSQEYPRMGPKRLREFPVRGHAVCVQGSRRQQGDVWRRRDGMWVSPTYHYKP